MVEIKQQLVPEQNRKATYGKGNPKSKLVVHQTGNRRKGANAKMHAKLQEGGYSVASWHIQSDDREIIQSWPFEYRLWHASTGRDPNGGNFDGIAWEICINEDGDYLKSLEVAAPGIAKVMRQEGIPMSGLTTHNAEDPKKKWCPAQILSGLEGVNWTIFRGMVQKAYDGNPVTLKPLPKPTNPPKVSKSINILAREVIDGKWGTNPKRRNDLIARGYDADAVQARVNDILKAKVAPKPAPKPTPQASDKSYKESGTFYPNDTIIVRDQPSTNGKIIARYYKGENVTYHTVHLKNGYVWLQYNRSNGGQGYIPCRTYSNGKYGNLWGTIK